MTEKLNSIIDAKIIDLTGLKGIVQDLEQESSQPEFWEDQDNAQVILGKLNQAKSMIERVDNWIAGKDDVLTYLELYDIDNDGKHFHSFTKVFISLTLLNLSMSRIAFSRG